MADETPESLKATHYAVLTVPFWAEDDAAADEMSKEILRLWNEQVCPDTPTELAATLSGWG